MRHLARPLSALLQDLLPTLFFAALVALHVPTVTVTLAAAGLAIAQIALMAALRRPIAPLQWASLGLVLVFGTATLLAHDVRFLMAKPTLVYTIVGLVMLKRGWMLRYLPPVAEGRGQGTMILFGYVWAGLMFVTAAANLVMAVAFTASWPYFLATFPIISKVVLFIVQYVTVRRSVVRELTAPAAA